MKVLRTNTEIKGLKEELSTERKKRQEAEEKVNIMIIVTELQQQQ